MTAAGSWWVYILRCADDTFYVGLARHLAARLREHNGSERRGARYTRGRRPVSLYLAHPCADRRTAAQLEWRVKQLPRERKAALVDATEWLDGEAALHREKEALAAEPHGADVADRADAREELS
ncbi:MAG TPA: GIY-YIG nuclease family protein [Thermomicrobiales bacterium]|jgi:putative endonuclease